MNKKYLFDAIVAATGIFCWTYIARYGWHDPLWIDVAWVFDMMCIMSFSLNVLKMFNQE